MVRHMEERNELVARSPLLARTTDRRGLSYGGRASVTSRHARLSIATTDLPYRRKRPPKVTPPPQSPEAKRAAPMESINDVRRPRIVAWLCRTCSCRWKVPAWLAGKSKMQRSTRVYHVECFRPGVQPGPATNRPGASIRDLGRRRSIWSCERSGKGGTLRRPSRVQI